MKKATLENKLTTGQQGEITQYHCSFHLRFLTFPDWPLAAIALEGNFAWKDYQEVTDATLGFYFRVRQLEDFSHLTLYADFFHVILRVYFSHAIPRADSSHVILLEDSLHVILHVGSFHVIRRANFCSILRGNSSHVIFHANGFFHANKTAVLSRYGCVSVMRSGGDVASVNVTDCVT